MVLPSGVTPLYEALVSQWLRAGRMVPGQADQHWTALVEAVPYLSVSSVSRRWPA